MILGKIPEMVTGQEGWADEAPCKESDPEAWFPEKGGSAREAKAICGTCPVKAPCLQWALDRDERFGIYGGATERDRRRMKKELAA
ncbi:WhiB family transcriptional regulator [Mycobacterium sp. DL99]|uniref:WhiB family transcriptional regulator n=1 Tax=Mycobacterium sp. DL99 TaxID=2528957 RepID=UPI001AEBF2F6|nr:WhiB family transcriptional regulator [Mycobacterium sp. DL99]